MVGRAAVSRARTAMGALQAWLRGERDVESDSAPAGREGEVISPRLAAALAGIDPDAVPDIAEVIVLHREFTEWAVWLPHGGRPWIAVRPASARAAGPDLPMIWADGRTAADLAARMRATDAQLTPGRDWRG